MRAAVDSCSADSGGWLRAATRAFERYSDASVVSERPHIEAPTVNEAQAPLRKPYRYLRNRLSQLDYQSVADKKLPISPGAIESVHGYVVQVRLKRLADPQRH